MCKLCAKYDYCEQCAYEFETNKEPATQKQIDYLMNALQFKNPDMFFDFDYLIYIHHVPNGDWEPYRGIGKATKGQATFAISWLTGMYDKQRPFERHLRHADHAARPPTAPDAEPNGARTATKRKEKRQ